MSGRSGRTNQAHNIRSRNLARVEDPSSGPSGSRALLETCYVEIPSFLAAQLDPSPRKMAHFARSVLAIPRSILRARSRPARLSALSSRLLQLPLLPPPFSLLSLSLSLSLSLALSFFFLFLVLGIAERSIPQSLLKVWNDAMFTARPPRTGRLPGPSVHRQRD